MKKIFMVLLLLTFIVITFSCGEDTTPYYTPAIYSSVDIVNNSGETIIQIGARGNGEVFWINLYSYIYDGTTQTVTFGYTVDFSITELKLYFENGDDGTKTITMSEYGQYSLNVNHTTDGTQWIYSSL